MRKIPTLFRRNPDDMRFVLPEVHPHCRWVLDGEGVATRKYDGTCVMFDGAHWWARREVKAGKNPPTGFVEVEHDANTGKTMGWEPAQQSAFWKHLASAMDDRVFEPGTYELCGPKINGNPEGLDRHLLLGHAQAEVIAVPRDFEGLRAAFTGFPHEGVVWHHPDGRMAKLKVRDFPRENLEAD
ncbi:hypothetical protein ORV05_03710 [Amycolatopsis cynarae]|uniref:RNA ligase domain-containing protein n=1 Tax=Amycolatopsis cynarae TaxID=2995223 RepID=A0ABY7B3P4_9PSEU|nr:hypothetical protein [Amycolatopsis sp. HUAS 11-8]WAL66917.1 hypothetical protein ORV05_03710 [Amycolatopsis sp. HUAS 11-8]